MFNARRAIWPAVLLAWGVHSSTPFYEACVARHNEIVAQPYGQYAPTPTFTRARAHAHDRTARTDGRTHKRTNAQTRAHLSPNRDAKFVYLHGMDNGLGNELLSVVSSFFLARTRVQRFNFISTHITSHHLTRESSTRHIASF